MSSDQTIRTSEPGWFAKLVAAYQDRACVILIDDAGVGINPALDGLLAMGRKAGLTWGEWQRVLGCLGVSGIGVGLIALAIFDPEPTSKLALLVGGGLGLAATGGAAAIYQIVTARPHSVAVHGPGLRICWAS
jgi:hypothetical protein